MYVQSIDFVKDVFNTVTKIDNPLERKPALLGFAKNLDLVRAQPLDEAYNAVLTANSKQEALDLIDGLRGYAQAGVHELPEV